MNGLTSKLQSDNLKPECVINKITCYNSYTEEASFMTGSIETKSPFYRNIPHAGVSFIANKLCSQDLDIIMKDGSSLNIVNTSKIKTPHN